MNEKPAKPRKNLLDSLLKRMELVPASDRLILRVLLFVMIGAGIIAVLLFNQQNSSLIATRGGTITEGILGTPRFVNPALAITRADQDVVALVYGGLLKLDPSGNLVPDIAESVTVAEDGLTYNVVIRDDARFHDGSPITAKDVIFTIQLVQDPDLKSPLRGNWTDVSLEEISDRELNIILSEAYAPFIENFTLGIMPAHLWGELPVEQIPFSQLNTEPIGSGPFQVTEAMRDQTGLITEYRLQAFGDTREEPKINTINLHFFAKESDILTALREEVIDTTAYISDENLPLVDLSEYHLIRTPLPRVFGIFFNQNRSAALRDEAVRKALSEAIDRESLIEAAVYGYGVPISSPTEILESELESENITEDNVASSSLETARATLTAGGWEQNELGFWEKELDDELTTLNVTIRTSNTPLFTSVLTEVVEDWQELGVEVVTDQFEQTGLVQSVIRPRDFEALLFGLDMSRSYDLYPFWHSSQQDDPGLNIAQYANLTVDDLLTDARAQQEKTARQETLIEASKIITSEYPAVFLFQPEFTYLTATEVTVPEMSHIGRPADRFGNTRNWHTRSDTLWPIFQDDM